MKICKDCKWYNADTILDMRFGKCTSPRRRYTVDRVTGERRFIFDYCSVLRIGGWLQARLSGDCGEEGRWFEPKDENNEEEENK